MRSTRIFGMGALSAVALLGSALAGSAQAATSGPGDTNPRNNGPAYHDNDFERFPVNIENAVIVVCNNGSGADDELSSGDARGGISPTANGSARDEASARDDGGEIVIVCWRDDEEEEPGSTLR